MVPVSMFAGESGSQEKGVAMLGWWAKHTEQGKNGLSYSHPHKKHKLVIICAYAANTGAFFR